VAAKLVRDMDERMVQRTVVQAAEGGRRGQPLDEHIAEARAAEQFRQLDLERLGAGTGVRTAVASRGQIGLRRRRGVSRLRGRDILGFIDPRLRLRHLRNDFEVGLAEQAAPAVLSDRADGEDARLGAKFLPDQLGGLIGGADDKAVTRGG
jgi:hypothetical protein